ncbi:MAG TPA: 1-(5-phosphoribosyl)-5-[(5-phosphoribosylamino)methylideneamino]imidazole-4-carboxamide isomerase [Candidatus Fimenecus stercoravium]|nr:1-(5-phosphoribosyl)-5-[(5-phosphoribosylamino)methylideneamino]imidazole-4-carboxamide isomerase [Candidatus Fimenecus stercoravium]
MIIFPAIDIKNETCVRLYRGEMDSAEQVADSYLAAADAFKTAGAEWIHMVDLDGACAGERKNAHVFLEVAEATGLQIEVGGGIRTMEDIEYYLSRGIARVVLGSAAVKDPQLVREACKAYGDKIAVGIDARNGFVATEGWVETGSVHFLELGKAMEAAGVRTLIFTDIDRDGMLSGPALDALQQLNAAVSCNVVASGGIKDVEDIRALKAAGLYGAICGRSIYKGTLSLQEALREAR